MGTNYIQTNQASFTHVGTTRLITIPTAPATQVAISVSAARVIFITNVGADAVAWGDSAVTALSGGILFYSMGKQWDHINQDWDMYFIADSVQSVIAVQELVDG